MTAEIKSFSYAGSRKKILQGISIKINEGDKIAFLGDSGSGKTTLINCLAGISPHLTNGALEGKIVFDNEVVSKTSLERVLSMTGMVFQNPETQLISHKVFDELIFGLENRGLGRKEIDGRLSKAKSFFDLKGLAGRKIEELSQGQKQLVALASALMQRPKILFLDEPTSMLDHENRLLFTDCLKKLDAKTIVLSTHDKKLAMELCDKIVCLDNGRIKA